jgi:uncharacterized protein YndB with AHSA1/START domain
MSKRSADHGSFTIERNFAAPVALVFKAWADPALKANWFRGPGTWEQGKRVLDFRVGGKEYVSGAMKGATAHIFDALYHDIVPNERIVYSYDMYIGEQRISVSLATIEFAAAGKGTRMIFTEQAVFLDGYDGLASREQGTQQLMNQFAEAIERINAVA